MHAASDGASEKSRKIFFAKIDPGQGLAMAPKNGRNFRKSDVSERQVEFWRPCRGLSPGKGFAPNDSTWLVETEIYSELEEQYLSSTYTGAKRSQNDS